MVERLKIKKTHPALKHGGYSKRMVLPGENISDFEKLHEDLVEEFGPSGPAEHDVVFTMARLFWRKQNLETFETARGVKVRRDEILEEEYRQRNVPTRRSSFDKEEIAANEASQVAAQRARKQLGDMYELLLVTEERMFEALAVEERLDAMIDKCIKRLLTLKGVKSMIAEPSPRSEDGPKLLGADKSAA
jgi:hypothetical protein